MGKATKIILTMFGIFGGIVFFSTLSPRGKDILQFKQNKVAIPMIRLTDGSTPTATASASISPTNKAVVNFDGKQFVPQTLTVKSGTKVSFINSSDRAMWVATADHEESQSKYPEFDAKKLINPAENFEFVFSKVGSWTYHDHVNHSITGTIVVEN